jgi:hypothetical protein
MLRAIRRKGKGRTRPAERSVEVAARERWSVRGVVGSIARTVNPAGGQTAFDGAPSAASVDAPHHADGGVGVQPTV